MIRRSNPRSLGRQAALAAGITMEVVAWVALFAWAQVSDAPLSDTGALTNICRSGGESPALACSLLSLIVLIGFIGMACHRWGARRGRQRGNAGTTQ